MEVFLLHVSLEEAAKRPMPSPYFMHLHSSQRKQTLRGPGMDIHLQCQQIPLFFTRKDICHAIKVKHFRFSPWAHYSAQVSGLLWVLQKEGLSSMSFHFWLVGWLSMRFENFSLKKKKPQWNISFYFFPVEKAYVTPSVMNFLMSRTSPHERRAEEK